MDAKLFVLIVLLAAAGCRGHRLVGPGPYVRPGLVMIPADQSHLYTRADPKSGNDIPATARSQDVSSVQTAGAVSVLQFNRYPDPACPEQLLHEAHVVYRRDSPPRWRLQAPRADEQILIGPQLTDGRGELKPMVSQELDAYLREQRTLLLQQQDLVSRVGNGMKSLAEQQEVLARKLAALQQAVSSAESEPEPPLSDDGENARFFDDE